MMFTPEVIALIAKGIQALIAAAPTIAKVAIEAKNFIASLFSKGLIDKETQDNLFNHVDEVCAAILAGQLPPEFAVEAD